MPNKDQIKRIEEFIARETRDLSDKEYIAWLEEVEERAADAREAKEEELDNEEEDEDE